MCEGRQLRVTIEGKYIFGDPAHFSDYGQEIIMNPLLKSKL